jgi:hypothetical protein
MGARNPQTFAKREREQAVRDKRARKAEKKAERAADRAAGITPDSVGETTELEPAADPVAAPTD